MKKTERRNLFILINEQEHKYVCCGDHPYFYDLDQLALENLHCSERAVKASLTKWKNYYHKEAQDCQAHINAIKNGTEPFFTEAALPRLTQDLKLAEAHLNTLMGCEIKKISVAIDYIVED